MKSILKAILLTTMLAAVILFNCTPTDPIPAGYGRLELNIQGTIPISARSSARAAITSLPLIVNNTAGTEIGTITLTTAKVVLKEIELQLAAFEVDTVEEETQNNEVEYNGPFMVDLLADTITPPLSAVDLLPGTYNEIKLKLDKIEGDEVDEDGVTPLAAPTDPLFGHSIYLAGTYTGTTAGGAVTDIPFELSFDIDMEFELTGLSDTSLGFILGESQINDIIIAFRLNKWFFFNNTETNPDSIDFVSLVTVNNAIVLDGNVTGNNVVIRNIIEKNIENSADYGKDEDHNAVLETDEDDDPGSEDASDE